MAAFLDNCKFTPTAGGATDWTYSAAVTGYQSPSAAGVVNGTKYKYFAVSADLTQWEIGEGVYNTSTGVLPRTTVLSNSSGTGTATGQSGAGSKINFSAAPQVAIVALAEDLISLEQANAFSVTQQGQARSNIGAVGFGFANKLRNSSLVAWFHGSGALTITTGGGFGAEGLYVVPAGASVTAQQSSNGLSNPLTPFSQKITGNTSVSDLVVRFVVESYDAAPLAGQQVTFQIPVLNNTGGSITPTITVKHATTQDNWTGNTGDVAAAALQSIANGATGVLAYSWLAPAGSINGLSITIDFGNNFSANTKSIQIGGGFDLRATPGVATGPVSNPPVPEIPPAFHDIEWCERFYETSYENGTAPGTATHTGMVNAGAAVASTGSVPNAQCIVFRTPKRAVPTYSMWDGAGSSNQNSNFLSGSWTDAEGPSTSVSGGICSRSALFTNTRSSGAISTNVFVHYAADATLTGA